MLTKEFIKILNNHGIDFFTGVPDSLLNSLCFDLLDTYKDNGQFQIGVNEGACAALAAGHYMATGKTPCVFMQNSGLGNIVNPYTSLMHDKVYAVPALFIVGWRGEPDVKDEPQHVFMGEITLKTLELLDIHYAVIDKNTTIDEAENLMSEFSALLEQRKSCAFVVKKDTFVGNKKIELSDNYEIIREDAIEHIACLDKNALIVSSTGKISRELFEIREKNNQSHNTDFLTVGSMGFASSVAVRLAFDLPQKHVICIDGDGAVLMHLGAMATIGKLGLNNFTHVILDNESHETVGGIPTVSANLNWEKLADAFGYKKFKLISSYDELNKLVKLEGGELILIKVKKFSRKDLGRPTLSAKENINNFMNYIQQKEERK